MSRSAGRPTFARAGVEYRRPAVRAEAFGGEAKTQEHIEPERNILGAAHVVELGHLPVVVDDELPADPRIHQLTALWHEHVLRVIRRRDKLGFLVSSTG